MRSFVISITLLSVLATMAPAAANHRPNFYCSESGDTCQSTRKDDGVRKLRVATAANYFDRYRVCVAPPRGEVACRTGTMRERASGTWEGSINWAERFPNEGSGAYTVTWRLTSGDRIGRRLGFHVR